MAERKPQLSTLFARADGARFVLRALEILIRARSGTGTGAQWSEIASCHSLGTAWAQNGIKRHHLGTGRNLTQWSGLRRPLDNSTNGRDFGPMVRPRGTAPNGHFDATLKTAGHS